MEIPTAERVKVKQGCIALTVVAETDKRASVNHIC